MVTVSDVKQYLFCPRIIYFDHVIHCPKPSDQKLQSGKEKHDEITAKDRRRKGGLFYDPELDAAEKSFRVPLESKNLGLVGVLDCLVISGRGNMPEHMGEHVREYIPIEYKFGYSRKGRVHLNHKYQLSAYALMVEERFEVAVRRGFVHYSRDRTNARVDFDDGIRRRTLDVIGDVRRIIEEEVEPRGTKNPGRCVECEYRRYCGGA